MIRRFQISIVAALVLCLVVAGAASSIADAEINDCKGPDDPFCHQCFQKTGGSDDWRFRLTDVKSGRAVCPRRYENERPLAKQNKSQRINCRRSRYVEYRMQKNAPGPWYLMVREKYANEGYSVWSSTDGVKTDPRLTTPGSGQEARWHCHRVTGLKDVVRLGFHFVADQCEQSGGDGRGPELVRALLVHGAHSAPTLCEG